MSSLTINDKDTVALQAELPRDLTDANVTFLFGQEEIAYQAIISDSSNGTVKVPLSQVDPDIGHHEIKWQITYNDGTVEVLPPHGDVLQVKD